jgi:hypothetical protein
MLRVDIDRLPAASRPRWVRSRRFPLRRSLGSFARDGPRPGASSRPQDDPLGSFAPIPHWGEWHVGFVRAGSLARWVRSRGDGIVRADPAPTSTLWVRSSHFPPSTRHAGRHFGRVGFVRHVLARSRTAIPAGLASFARFSMMVDPLLTGRSGRDTQCASQCSRAFNRLQAIDEPSLHSLAYRRRIEVLKDLALRDLIDATVRACCVSGPIALTILNHPNCQGA